MTPPDSPKDRARRERMVEEQLAARGISDPRVLDAMRTVPRHCFMPAPVRDIAYRDGAVPIGKKQTISQPFIVAYMTQALRLTGTEHVLEVGTGTGYQTAVLCELAARVTSLERFPLLAGRAGNVLEQIGYENVEVHIGDGSQGLPDMAPYDAIIVTAAAPALPQPLRMQLHPQGGRMILPIGSPGQQHLEVIDRNDDNWTMRRLIAVRFVPLVGQYGFSLRGGKHTEADV